jgi:3-dehydroquinate dehydratase type I
MKIITPFRPDGKQSMSTFLQNRHGQADFTEIWLDQWHDDYFFNLLKQIIKSGMHLIGCCKSKNEHGLFTGNQSQRIDILKRFLDAGGAFVDLDITHNNHENIYKIPPKKLILSFHDFSRVPQNLEKIFTQMQTFNPAIYKFSVTIKTDSDLEKFLTFARKLPRNEKIIFSTMGAFGSKGRQILRKQNLTWAEFVALDEQNKTASGQRILEEILED